MHTWQPRRTRQTLAVLGTLLEADSPIYGLDISYRTELPAGTVYPILARPERAGWLVNRWEEMDETVEGRRRYYRLTPEGRIAADETLQLSSPPRRRSLRAVGLGQREIGITDAQWAKLASLLPPQRRTTGRPSRNHRAVIEGILWVLARDEPWRNVPAEYGPWQTVAGRFYQWRREGLWDRIMASLEDE